MTAPSKGTALITGASSGIGAVYADRLARRGYDLILVARRRERLDRLTAQLGSETRRSIEVVSANLYDRVEMLRVETILRTDDRISMLVNNAGVGAVDPLLESDVEKMEAMITLNVTALTRLNYAAGPSFVGRGGGTIINISSVVGVYPELLNGVYGATKAFVLALSLSMQKELAARKLRVQAVLPGAVATDFWADAGKPVETLPPEMVMRADDLVDAALAGLDAGELVTIPSLPDAADWQAFESARRNLFPNLSRNQPAPRYRARTAA